MMSDMPLSVSVRCTDGGCGQSVMVIVNPVSHKVTHLVIADESLPNNSTRLVPMGKVASTSEDGINLNCTKADVAKMQPFVEAHFVADSPPGGYYSSGQAYAGQYVFNDSSYDIEQGGRIPHDELPVYPGMQVEASDGKVGKLDELVLDSETGDITHLTMREGHLWGKKDVTIPVSDVDLLDEETIYLKIDRRAVRALPAVKVRR
jgi:sporulation protein YlmC with PRC-barrel domain